eukprot:TRINITY_DN3337_c0_g1_i1.p1 TRINITY_DN3337_c0_g1~~TRINITY_DN3337_c0_g1_i1.p1  ORF type:complete len:227 (-),score=37.00 TRINITY_DN3337_c0_g1_i1:972-1652(-)
MPNFLRFFCCGSSTLENKEPEFEEADISTNYQLPKRKDSRKCLVLDLDETLVHSSFRPIPNPDYTIPVEIDGVEHKVYVRQRPGAKFLLRELRNVFEIVVFTASLAKYADPLLDLLDDSGAIEHRLFRESCVQYDGQFVKDMALLGRPMNEIIIVDNSPASYMFQTENAIPSMTFIEDPDDRELYAMIPFLRDCAKAEDVRTILPTWNGVETVKQRNMCFTMPIEE